MSETLPVLLLQLGEAPEPVRRLHGTYPAWYERAWDGPLQAVDGRTGRLPNPNHYAGIVITGSPSSLTDGERPEWADEAGALVRKAHDAGIPTLGVCFGHQLIAWAFGARVVRNPHGWEIGSQD